MDGKNMKLGINMNFDNVREDSPQFKCVCDKVDFMVAHTDPQREALPVSTEKTLAAVKLLDDRGIDYVANFEFQNFGLDATAPDGTEWVLNTEKLHRLAIPDEYIKALNTSEHFKGVMYDEFEHAIINQNLSIILSSKRKIKRSVFPLLDGKDPYAQGELLDSQIGEYAAEIKGKGAKIFIGEHVFPVLLHTFARNGIIPNFKSQKEGVTDLCFAIAAGAAKQYDVPLWTCVDCWFRMTNPGHSADEMYYNLKFADLAGVNNAYVESTSVFVDENGSPNDYAKRFAEFSDVGINRERSYDIRDYRPEVGVIRYDDTYWGQGDPVMWRYMLFGNKKIKPDRRSKEILGIFRLITHGETSRYCFNWDKIHPWAMRRHRSFMTMNSVAVFDDRVLKGLESLKLCFLSGIHIGDGTLAYVAKLVRENGLTVVTPKRFAPENIRKKAKKNYSEIEDGKGLWIVTDRISSNRVKKKIAPFLGQKGEIRLTFDGGKEIRLKISEDGDSFEAL
ncbi:MAG: hypothetical protein K6F09_03130 [Clostridiales bacterium]|nr:hypothetical protein [Clostridiales bacterium]